MFVGKPQYAERGHGIGTARLALRNEAAKLRKPFAQPRIAAALCILIVAGDRGIKRRRWIQRGLVAIHGHAIRGGDIKTPEARVVMVLERFFVADGAHTAPNIRIAFMEL